jgi:plastocyanin
MNRRWLLTLVIATVFVAPSAQAATSVNEVPGNLFSPDQVEISVNDKVVWTNRSNASHTVTFDNGPDLHSACDPRALLQVGCQGPGATAERTFAVPGTYPYYCKIHGDRGGQGMSGVVVVAAKVTTTSATVATTSSTLPRASATSSTVKASTSSTTATTRPLATSSTLASSSTTSTTADTSSVLLPGDPPPFAGEDANSAAGQSGGSDEGSDTATMALIVALLLAVAAGGGYLLWRLRPGRA